MPDRTLLLFDLDGTLLVFGQEEHFDALYLAVERVYGNSGADQIAVDKAGRTDVEIARLVLAGLGTDKDEVESGLPELERAWVDAYHELCPNDLTGRVVPGIVALLERLQPCEARLGVLTGNLEPIARLKLERSRLAQFFDPTVGAFGSDEEDRGRLPDIARTRAGGDAAWPRERTILIGDTPRDIAAARAGGIRCVAVATGPHPAADLTEADAVAEDASALERILVELTGCGPASASPRTGA